LYISRPDKGSNSATASDHYDHVASGAATIDKLNGLLQDYFTVTIRVPEQYQNDSQQWIDWDLGNSSEFHYRSYGRR
jgi:hypothetical protein